jgi:hypothetical protein
VIGIFACIDAREPGHHALPVSGIDVFRIAAADPAVLADQLRAVRPERVGAGIGQLDPVARFVVQSYRERVDIALARFTHLTRVEAMRRGRRRLIRMLRRLARQRWEAGNHHGEDEQNLRARMHGEGSHRVVEVQVFKLRPEM